MPDRPASAVLPRTFQFWPEDESQAVQTDPAAIARMYEAGFAGAWEDSEAKKEFEEFIESQSFGSLDGHQLALDNGLSGSGAGRLVIPFVFVDKYFKGCWPGAAQQRGDCVSHSQKNANLLTMACDIASGKPDEVSGVVEGLPEIDPTGITQGALSTEAIYWHRGYSGDGWQCEIAAKVACTKAGLWLRNNYPDLGIDLRKYSGSLAGKYGRSAPPSEIVNYGSKYLIRTATRLRSAEDWRDYLANGYGLTTCGGEGYSSKRDENGYSRRSGSWAHAMACIGFDDRDVIKQKYGEPLVLIINSWGRWNSGGRRILGTDIDIPEGSFWTKWSEVRNRSCTAMSGAAGWPAKNLPPFELIVG